MTNMKIVSFAIPDELDRAILEKTQNDSARLSYSEVIRRLLYKALDMPCPDTRPGRKGVRS